MSIGSILSWIICGLIVGAIARVLVPGRERMSVPLTAALGIIGALVGGFLYSLVRGPSVQPFSLATHNWHGWIVAIMGAVLVVWVYPQVHPRQWWR